MNIEALSRSQENADSIYKRIRNNFTPMCIDPRAATDMDGTLHTDL